MVEIIETAPRRGYVVLDWNGGNNQKFQLGIAGMERVQESCDAGVQVVFGRLSSNTWYVQDIVSPILHGLIGGGVNPTKARKLVKEWVEDRPLSENLVVATAILMAALVGAPDDLANDRGELEAGETPPSPAEREMAV